jgi:hypothetical protein
MQSGEFRISIEFKPGITALDRALQTLKGLLLFACHGVYLDGLAEYVRPDPGRALAGLG